MKSAENFTPCRWPECLYYGKRDEGGNACDQFQVAVCEEIRAEAARQRETEASG